MNAALVDSRRPWVTSQDSMPPALEIVLLKRSVVLSWNQFVYAEGADDEVRIAFASHDVIVRGAGLVLAFMFALAVIAAQGRNQDQNAVSEN